jgi:hypothetical protein
MLLLLLLLLIDIDGVEAEAVLDRWRAIWAVRREEILAVEEAG